MLYASDSTAIRQTLAACEETLRAGHGVLSDAFIQALRKVNDRGGTLYIAPRVDAETIDGWLKEANDLIEHAKAVMKYRKTKAAKTTNAA